VPSHSTPPNDYLPNRKHYLPANISQRRPAPFPLQLRRTPIPPRNPFFVSESGRSRDFPSLQDLFNPIADKLFAPLCPLKRLPIVLPKILPTAFYSINPAQIQILPQILLPPPPSFSTRECPPEGARTPAQSAVLPPRRRTPPSCRGPILPSAGQFQPKLPPLGIVFHTEYEPG